MPTLTFCFSIYFKPQNIYIYLQCNSAPCLYSCFLSFQKHRQVDKHALLSPSLPPCDSSHLIPHGFIFYHVCSTDFEENEQAIASPG